MAILSKTERQFLEDLKRGNVDGYSKGYRRKLKHQILQKKDLASKDITLLNETMPMLNA